MSVNTLGAVAQSAPAQAQAQATNFVVVNAEHQIKTLMQSIRYIAHLRFQVTGWHHLHVLVTPMPCPNPVSRHLNLHRPAPERQPESG